MGNPDEDHVSTSYVERSNLTMRMSMRRFTRLTNAFSKKIENHAHMVAIYTVWYNWVRIHKSLRVTPAMAANLTDRLWGWEEIVASMEAGQMPLEQSLAAYKRGAELLKFCQSSLQDAQQQVKILEENVLKNFGPAEQ